MTGSSSRRLPHWGSLDEVVDYFDTHDMGEYLDQLHQVQVEVDIKRKRHLVAIDDDILARVAEVAKQRKISAEELINTWLRERLLS